ncbi:MAG: CerR family C-terminal domain-containing protein, partial [Pseudomonadota bacterium]
AEHGFQSTTVREICARAGANVAAVNYHFRDKMGLYEAVLSASLCVAAHQDIRRLAEASQSPEQALRLIIAGMLRRMSQAGERGAWHVRIMAHEMARPTAGLDRVIEQVIGPNYAIMRQVLAAILGLPPEHETTRLCAHSVIGQVVHYAHARPVIARIWPELTMSPDRIEQIAQHIAAFSLAALRSFRKSGSGSKPGKERTQ